MGRAVAALSLVLLALGCSPPPTDPSSADSSPLPAPSAPSSSSPPPGPSRSPAGGS